MILKTPALWKETVPDGDPNHYGTNYLDRAKSYASVGWTTPCDQFIVPYLINKTDRNREYFPSTPDYGKLDQTTSKKGQGVPWNQQFMLDNGFQHLAECHDILGDAPDRVKAYDSYVRAILLVWLLSEVTSHPDPKFPGSYYNWNYSLVEGRHA